MDSDRRSALVERLEVAETGRRRRWSEDEKLKIVLESLAYGRRARLGRRRGEMAFRARSQHYLTFFSLLFGTLTTSSLFLQICCDMQR
jgi:hypothetical protein